MKPVLQLYKYVFTKAGTNIQDEAENIHPGKTTSMESTRILQAIQQEIFDKS